MKFGLTNKEIGELFQYFKSQKNIKRVYIFGSRARGDFKETSDIDFAIEFENLDESNLSKVSFDIEDIKILYEIDLVDIDFIKSTEFKNNVNRDKTLFYAK